ncbi:hypothetical protein [Lysinibacillus endophyticus]|nr:hypothetical protein [Lysinibacillus endophyticus]MCP1145287.1 hypothetical protein [Lysinibacillus endophyticus]
MMYHEITVDRSLFYIEQHHVDTFLSIAEKLKDYSYIVKDGAMPQEDAWIVAFNAWLLLLPDDHIIIQSVEKSLYYTSNYIIYNALIKDVHFQNLKQRKDATPEFLYIVSLFLASSLNDWILFVMDKYNLSYMAEKNRELKYFDALQGTESEIQDFLKDQSLFVKAAILELKTDSFSQMLKKCSDDAYFFYLENLMKQKI